MRISLAVEGQVDERVGQRLIELAGAEPWTRLIAGGHGRLDPRVQGFNAAAVRAPWLVLRDLDREPCAVGLASRLLGEEPAAPFMAMRIAVAQVESWLLADTDGMSAFFSVAAAHIPLDPDREADPKRALVDACRRSGIRRIRDGMAPSEGGGRKVGPQYTSLITAFVGSTWQPERARRRSESLDRCLARLSDVISCYEASLPNRA